MNAPQGARPGAAELGATWPDLPTFLDLARERRIIPVVRRLLADAETPVGIYRKLAKDRVGSFLLESAEHGGVWSRYSIVGAASSATLTECDGEATWLGTPPVGVPSGGDPLEALRDTVAMLATEPLPGMPPLTGGLVGMIGYDAVRRWESVPDENPDDLRLPELAMMLTTDLAVLDHADATVLLVANAINVDGRPEHAEEAYTDAVARLDRMTDDLSAPAPSTVATMHRPTPEPRSTTTEAGYLEIVEAGKEAIRAGEVFQVVLSQRFDVPCPADALDVYRVLRVSNPSPYMYLLRLQRPDGTPFDVVGSSPEALVKVTGRHVITHPIAGSRPRGATPEEDRALEDELRADEKECAEHVMLVDLSRNDLQRVCEVGSVEVVEFMDVRRYSHIMHLESTVVGDLEEGRTAYDALAATFPAGTLSGAPKPRALALIDELETTRRGVYGGVVGYLDVHGDLDMAIAIRTAVIGDGRAYVQAGAGIVADSRPEAEYAETHHKAAAVLRAVAAASTLEAP
ncbi:anthranilate synthase component I [Mobilicoccus pelagius]|uniref:Anthranilate synthase component 1 n=1 Tax=Mobilicoccus pelagius NBRC 104925 TaxID=1089455 RepID=H5UQ67_9MICO|nr:anthranilate synthase component I [Mobilicoccus pelagius]GAB47872.1 anthranilate synthase component I [Mobilicoccus pelagius NBRC 104925]